MKNTDSERNDAATGTIRLVPASSSHPIAGVPPEARYEVPPFDPVPVKPRHDGWTPERQRDFIEALAATACVEDAAKAVGMSSKSAFLLRLRPDAGAFRDAWSSALHFAVATLEAKIFSRAVHGVPVPHYYKGELVGEHRRYNDRLAMFLLRHNDLARYAKGYDAINPRELTNGARATARAHQLFDRMDILEHGRRPQPQDADGEEGFHDDMD